MRLSLLQLANASGAPLAGGWTRIPPLPHRTIAEYPGTSREIVTHEMNLMRQQGLLRYSRAYIEIHMDAVREALSGPEGDAAREA